MDFIKAKKFLNLKLKRQRKRSATIKYLLYRIQKTITIALDMMSGDHGIETSLPAALKV